MINTNNHMVTIHINNHVINTNNHMINTNSHVIMITISQDISGGTKRRVILHLSDKV